MLPKWFSLRESSRLVATRPSVPHFTFAPVIGRKTMPGASDFVEYDGINATAFSLTIILKEWLKLSALPTN